MENNTVKIKLKESYKLKGIDCSGKAKELEAIEVNHNGKMTEKMARTILSEHYKIEKVAIVDIEPIVSIYEVPLDIVKKYPIKEENK